MAHVQRSVGIGRDEFEYHALAVPGVALPVTLAALEHLPQQVAVGSADQVEIDEPGARHLGPRHQRAGR